MGSVYRLPKSVRDAAVERFRAGEDKAAVAEELGVHPSTLQSWALVEHLEAHTDRARAGLAAKYAEAPKRTGIHPAMLVEVMGL